MPVGSMPSIFKALWRGEIGLAKTTWLYGPVGAVILALPVEILRDSYLWFENFSGYGEPGLGPRLLYIASNRGVTVWIMFICVAMWRSASTFNGRYDWAFIAKIFASYSIFSEIFQLVMEVTVTIRNSIT